MADLTIEEIEQIAQKHESIAQDAERLLAGRPEGADAVEHYGRMCALSAVAIRQLLKDRQWRDIDDVAKNGSSHLFLCIWEDQTGYAEQKIVLRWDIDGWFDWNSVRLHESIPVAYIPLPSPPDVRDLSVAERSSTGQPPFACSYTAVGDSRAYSVLIPKFSSSPDGDKTDTGE